jgi:hypothetical protein
MVKRPALMLLSALAKINPAESILVYPKVDQGLLSTRWKSM